MSSQKKDPKIELSEPINNVNFYFKRSQSKLKAGQIENALEDAKSGIQLDANNFSCNLQECDCIYEQNEFEQNLVKLSQNSRKFMGHRLQAFDERKNAVKSNIQDIFGKNAKNSLLEREKIITRQYRENNIRSKSDRPLWKVLRENELCDVASVLEIKEEQLGKKSATRIEQNWKHFTQTYLPNGWKDIKFLKNLKKHNLLNLPQTVNTNKTLIDTVNDGYEKAMESVEMLHARCPLYSKKNKRFGSKTAATAHKEKHLFRIQQETRRDVFNQLDHLKELRKAGQLSSLVKLAEGLLENYYEIKTLRVLPRKMEFVNEICNVVALAHADTLKIPADLFQYAQSERIFHLFNINPLKKDLEAPIVYKFGEKSTYRDPTHVDSSYLTHKNHTTKLERMALNSKYETEQAFLYHQIATIHLKQGKLYEAKSYGRKVIAKAEISKNHLWIFLGILTVCKIYILQRKVEKLNNELNCALEVTQNLAHAGNKLNHIIEAAIKLNKNDINAKLENEEILE